MCKPTVARKLQRVIGNQSAKDLVISVRSNIKNCPVTAADAKLVEKINGPNIVGVQDKIVRRSRLAYKIDQIPINAAKKYRSVTLVADIFYVNIIWFCVSITKYIGFGTTQPIANGKVETLVDSLDAVVNLYHIRGFRGTLSLMEN